jgi:hypothetical protein
MVTTMDRCERARLIEELRAGAAAARADLEHRPADWLLPPKPKEDARPSLTHNAFVRHHWGFPRPWGEAQLYWDGKQARGSNYSVIDIGQGKRGFQWVWTRQTPSLTVPVGGVAVTTPPQTQSCTVTMIASTTKATPALGDWVIESWRWNGAC